MKFNDEMIKVLHNLLGQTYGITLIFEEGRKEPLCSSLIGLRKTTKGNFIGLFESEDEEFEAISPQDLMKKKITPDKITKPNTDYLG